MKVLVIGGNRFFGKQLVEKLLDEGHQVAVLNRGNLLANYRSPLQPELLFGDRNDAKFLKQVAESANWDVVYDQACFEAGQARAAASIFKFRTSRYIFTSSQAVYFRNERNLAESEFSPFAYGFAKDVLSKNGFGEAKRQCEAIFHQEMPEKTVSVRFPIVIGLDDYLERIDRHVDAVLEEKELFYPNSEADISFLSSTQAADALAFLGASKFVGPINVSSPDWISIRDFIELIGDVAEKKPRFATQDTGRYSALDWRQTRTMSVALIRTLGFQTAPMKEWLRPLINLLVERSRKNQYVCGAFKTRPFRRNDIAASVVSDLSYPFRILQFKDFFSAEIYEGFESSFRTRLIEGTSEHYQFGKLCRSDSYSGDKTVSQRYGAYVSQIHERDRGPFGIFYSRVFFDFLQTFFATPFSPHLMATVHHHKKHSPTGWIHSDFNFCNFLWHPNEEGLNPFSGGCTYQKGYDLRSQVLKCVRSVAVMYYFANKPWTEGEGGETAFFKEKNWEGLFLKVPPLNNMLCAFEITPSSYHTFMSNIANERNAVAFWFHSEKTTALQNFNQLPIASV